MGSPLRPYLKDEEKAGKKVAGLFVNWANQISANYHRKWIYYWRLYWGYRPPSPVDPFRSNVHLPMLQAAVDTMLPRVYQAAFATEPAFHANPRSPSIDMQLKGEIVENLIWKNWQRTNRQLSAELAMKDAIITGIGFEKCSWNIDVDVDGLVKKDRPEWSRVGPMDLFWRPEATRIEDTPLIQWRPMRLSQLRDMNDSGANFKNMDQIEEMYTGGADRGYKHYNINDLYFALGLNGPLFQSDTSQNEEEGEDPWIVLLEYHDDCYSVMVDAGTETPITEIRKNVLGEKPFTCYQCNPLGDLMVGKGLGETLAPLQEAMNNYENAYLDNAIQGVHNMWFLDDTVKATQEDFIPMPNKMIKLNVPAGKSLGDIVQQHKPKPMSNGGREEQQSLTSWYRAATGQSEIMQGSGAQRQETYGGQASQLREANMRNFLDINRFSFEVARSARIEFLMLKHYMEEYTTVGVTGRTVPIELVQNNFFPEFYDINGHPQLRVGPGLFAGVPNGAFEFLPTGSQGLAIKEYIQQQIMQLMGELIQDPYIGAQPVPMADPASVQATMELRMREIAASEMTGKDQIVRLVSNAYMSKMNQYAMLQQQQMGMPMGGQPGQPQAQQPGQPVMQSQQQLTPNEQEAQPPAQPPQPMG